ncbi:MAG: hypothetical protein M3R69_02655, partial [Acidobacteriota bacterium]|nr:hypothetical protein [Acidobacteriota bacterium]
SADKGEVVVDRVDGSNVSTDILDKNGVSMTPMGAGRWDKTLGTIMPPRSPVMKGISYSCDGSTFTIVQTFAKSTTTFVMKRQRP